MKLALKTYKNTHVESQHHKSTQAYVTSDKTVAA
jgi:hypothetical protein